jgi:hypothetical protein
MKCAYRVLVGKSQAKDHFADLDIDGSIVLKWVLQKWAGRSGTEMMWLSIGRGRRALVTAVLNFRVT